MIGILDIFGFEVFDENSLEQLHINYTNEKMQKQFNDFVFAFEQAEYAREGIEWSFVDFPSNDAVLELIEAAPAGGLLTLIDEEGRVPGGHDAALASKIVQRLGGHARLSATSAQKVRGQFAVCHYAGLVVYTVAGFVEKNSDKLMREAVELLAGADAPLVARMFARAPEPRAARRASVTGAFRGQLDGASVRRARTSRAASSPTTRTRRALDRRRLVERCATAACSRLCASSEPASPCATRTPSSSAAAFRSRPPRPRAGAAAAPPPRCSPRARPACRPLTARGSARPRSSPARPQTRRRARSSARSRPLRGSQPRRARAPRAARSRRAGTSRARSSA